MFVNVITQRLDDGLYHIAMVEANSKEVSNEQFVQKVAIKSGYHPAKHQIMESEVKKVGEGRYIVAWKSFM